MRPLRPAKPLIDKLSITSRRPPNEEGYLSKVNQIAHIPEPRSATALRNVHTAEGDTTHQSARTSLFGYKKPEHMLVATGKSSVTYPVVVVEVCGIRCRALLDTGAGNSYASAALLGRIGEQPVRKEFRRIETLVQTTDKEIEIQTW